MLLLIKLNLSRLVELKFIYSEKAKHFCEISTIDLSYVGRFQLVDLIITELKDHMIC